MRCWFYYFDTLFLSYLHTLPINMGWGPESHSRQDRYMSKGFHVTDRSPQVLLLAIPKTAVCDVVKTRTIT